MKVRSLLNRNPEGDYKFSHKSILEFFLAKEIYKDQSFKKLFDEEGMDMTMNFYDELCYINDYTQFVSTGKHKSQLKTYYNNTSIENKLSNNDLLKVNKLILENFNESDLRAIRCFKNIEVLTIKNSQIESLDDINNFQNLQELKILNSKVKEYRRVSLLNSITKLSLVGVNLFDYQKNEINWKELNRLIYLNLTDNSITNIDGIKMAKSIKTLNISKNSILEISIPNHLEQVDISNNKLTDLDIKADRLKTLITSNNQIHKFKLNKNKPLKSLDLSNNQLRSIIIDNQNCLELLCLSNCGLTNKSVENIKPCKTLIELDISENQISKLNNLMSLGNLKKINISNTAIEKIENNDLPKSIKEILFSDDIKIGEEIGIHFKLDKKGSLIKKR